MRRSDPVPGLVAAGIVGGLAPVVVRAPWVAVLLPVAVACVYVVRWPQPVLTCCATYLAALPVGLAAAGIGIGLVWTLDRRIWGWFWIGWMLLGVPGQIGRDAWQAWRSGQPVSWAEVGAGAGFLAGMLLLAGSLLRLLPLR